MFNLTKECRFEAAHFIPSHKGPCKNLHGHSYRVIFEVESDRLDENGFVIDFGDLSVLCKSLDHTCLNDLPQFAERSTTAENIAQFLAKQVLALAPQVNRVKVTV